ncbi:hypothetical protein ACWEGE_36300 [Amycolatopsis sp. NPDC004747]
MIDYGLDLSAVPRDQARPDLVAEGEELDALVSAAPDWTRPAPAAKPGHGTRPAPRSGSRAARSASASGSPIVVRSPKTGLTAVGEDARKWLEVAQVFL